MQDEYSGNLSRQPRGTAAAEGRRIAAISSQLNTVINKFAANPAAQSFQDPTYTAAVPAQRLAASGDAIIISDDEGELSGTPQHPLPAQLPLPPLSAIHQGTDAATTAPWAAETAAEAAAQPEVDRTRVAGNSTAPVAGVSFIASAGRLLSDMAGKLTSPLKSVRTCDINPGWVEGAPSSSSGGCGGGTKAGGGSDGGANTACKTACSQKAARRRAQNKVHIGAYKHIDSRGPKDTAGHPMQADRMIAEQLQHQQQLEAQQQRQPPLSAGPSLPARTPGRSSGCSPLGHVHGPGRSVRCSTRLQSQTTMKQHYGVAAAVAAASPHTPPPQDGGGQRLRSVNEL